MTLAAEAERCDLQALEAECLARAWRRRPLPALYAATDRDNVAAMAAFVGYWRNAASWRHDLHRPGETP